MRRARDDLGVTLGVVGPDTWHLRKRGDVLACLHCGAQARANAVDIERFAELHCGHKLGAMLPVGLRTTRMLQVLTDMCDGETLILPWRCRANEGGLVRIVLRVAAVLGVRVTGPTNRPLRARTVLGIVNLVPQAYVGTKGKDT